MIRFLRVSFLYVFFVYSLFVSTCYCAQKIGQQSTGQPVDHVLQLPVRSLEQAVFDLDRLIGFLAEATAVENKKKKLSEKLNPINKIEYQDFRAEVLLLDRNVHSKGLNVLMITTLRLCVENQLLQISDKISALAALFGQEKVATEQELKEIELINNLLEKSNLFVEYIKKLFPFVFSSLGKAISKVTPHFLRKKAFKKVIPMSLTSDLSGGDFQIVLIDGTLDETQQIGNIIYAIKEKIAKDIELINKNAKKYK